MKLYRKYKDFILYVFFGVCTTLVNVVTYYIGTRWLKLGVMPGTVLAWCLAVLFAYVTNRKYVFKSENHTFRAITIEFGYFISCRLLTGAIDLGVMYLFVERMGLNDLIIKILSNIFVIISNYIASKIFIFKDRNNKADKTKAPLQKREYNGKK